LAYVNLTFTPSEIELVSGVPQSVAIESDVPATIYYTTDSTAPGLDSLVYVDPISIPTSLSSFTLSAFGIDGDGYESDILTQTFAADPTQLNRTRLVNGEGVVVDAFDDPANTITGFDASGVAGSFTDLTDQFLYDQSIHSAHHAPGDQTGTLVEVNIPKPADTPNPYDDQFTPYSNTRYAATFNPYAKTITIDNREANEVNPILRPWGSLEDIYRENGGVRVRSSSEGACYVSGGFTRRFYDRANGVMVSYYFDHNEARWIKNTQAMPTNVQATAGVYSAVDNQFVFRWIPRGKHNSNMV
jgi:hypothetical protein